LGLPIALHALGKSAQGPSRLHGSTRSAILSRRTGSAIALCLCHEVC